jgi:hypothetical protein
MAGRLLNDPGKKAGTAGLKAFERNVSNVASGSIGIARSAHVVEVKCLHFGLDAKRMPRLSIRFVLMLVMGRER